jgi:Xaa-Pro aminopeptidase
MPVSDMIRLGTSGHLTNQQIADLALEADREARRLRKVGGDLVKAAEADKESEQLCSLMS